MATILQRAGFAGAKFALMNYAPVFAASQSPSPVARYDEAMRLYLLQPLPSPIVSMRRARFIRRRHNALARVDGRLVGLQGASAGHKRDVIDASLLAARAFARAVGATSVHAIVNCRYVLDRLSGASKLADSDAYWRDAVKATIVTAMQRLVALRTKAAGARALDGIIWMGGRRRCSSSLRRRCGSSPRRARC